MVVGRPETAGTRARPVLITKVQPPVQRSRVPRPRLLALCTGAPRKLTVIRAPAGWGKSTLLAEWHAAAGEQQRFAWLALDREDNDPVRFWSYVIEALRTQHPDAGTTSLPVLEAARVDIVRDVLPVLGNELATATARDRAGPRRLPPDHRPGDPAEPRRLRRPPAAARRARAGDAVGAGAAAGAPACPGRARRDRRRRPELLGRGHRVPAERAARARAGPRRRGAVAGAHRGLGRRSLPRLASP